MTENKDANIPHMDIDSIVRQLSLMYGKAILCGIPVSGLPGVILWGLPGIGKSQSARLIADAISEATGRTVNVTDIRLLLFTAPDTCGLSPGNIGKSLAAWLKPQIIDMDDGDDVVNILFLNGLSDVPASVQAAAYQIALDKVVGTYRLPENCIVIGAGNSSACKSAASAVPKALANGLLHIEAEVSFGSWKRQAISQGIHPKVRDFLSFCPQALIRFNSSSSDPAFPTPRSWEQVSKLLSVVNGDISAVYPLICGLIGSETALEFNHWNDACWDMPDIEGIFEGTEHSVPKDTDRLYTLTSAMLIYARFHKNDMRLIANSVKYALTLPTEFSERLLREYMCMAPGYREKLLDIPEFAARLSEEGSLLIENAHHPHEE